MVRHNVLTDRKALIVLTMSIVEIVNISKIDIGE